MENGSNSRVTVPDVLAMKGREPITMLTAYDYPTARIVDEAGIDITLVGDSLAMVVLGHENTLAVTMDEMLHHTRAAARGTRRALLVADMPYLAYHVSIPRAVENGGRFLKEAGAAAVKIEGGRKRRDVIEALVDAEIPVMGHIGLTPQSIHRMGGYRVQGREQRVAEALLADAQAVEQAGAFAIVLEGIPKELASLITRSVAIPTIGIGAGNECDGQVLVFHDLVKFGVEYAPKFVRSYFDLQAAVGAAVQEYIRDVKARCFPANGESYHASSEMREFLALSARGGGHGDR